MAAFSMTVPLEASESDDSTLASDVEAQPVQFLFPPLRSVEGLAALERPQPSRLSSLGDPLCAEPASNAEAPAAATIVAPPVRWACRRAVPTCVGRLRRLTVRWCHLRCGAACMIRPALGSTRSD